MAVDRRGPAPGMRSDAATRDLARTQDEDRRVASSTKARPSRRETERRWGVAGTANRAAIDASTTATSTTSTGVSKCSWPSHGTAPTPRSLAEPRLVNGRRPSLLPPYSPTHLGRSEWHS